ncbi:DUF4136 domain-containing protein [Xylophilus sp.]|uniref:DUF4136 domain-containing protein n=1 Tax=Xylophilus sp. TaxID=2653893 RepID=UPI0013B620D6|nr:DUF4136 domain-containing protein [Xylophilus sp.]KAF1047964.1 MAG: hypothetical protein GAK38_01675 [Xylophilus sp.]
MHFPAFPRLGRRTFAAFAAAAALLLAGCASTLDTKVTRFQAWPADGAGSTFSFGRHAAVGRELEQSTYEQYVREELERRGLRSAPAGQAGRFLVEVEASGSQRQQRYLQPMYQDYRVYIPARRLADGRVVGGYWAADPWGPQYMGDREQVRLVQVSKLIVRIRETQPPPAAPRSVYEATAVYEGIAENLPDLVPFLARAAFDGFPGRNGETRRVVFDAQTGALVQQQP